MIRIKKNQNQFLPKEKGKNENQQMHQRDHKRLNTQVSLDGSRLTEERLKNQGKIHAKTWANAGAEEAPMHCNANAKWERVR